MTINIRPAEPSDIGVLSDLLLADARERYAIDPFLWKLENNPREKILSAIAAEMENEKPPFRQQILIADIDGKIVGVTHSMLLPAPPIYAGESGSPGFIMEDSFVVPNAPRGTRSALFGAAEADLIGAGAQILLASSVEGGAWESECTRQGYEPLTRYFAKTNLSQANEFANVRKAKEADVPAIVTSSATNRQILWDLNERFWKPHADADSRSDWWMRHSLTLGDRDMFVSELDGRFQGYAISQPATPLHFPTPHDISGIGVIDDYYHDELEDPNDLSAGGANAAVLLEAAEVALEKRGNSSALIVCPTAWKSKIVVLERAGYSNAITWFVKIHGQAKR